MKSTSATQLAILLCFCETASGILFVQRNEARGFDSLDGLWTFVREPFNSHGLGFQHKWHTLDISTFENATVMPVPSAFNDIDAHASLRDHVGWVWYQTEYRVNKRDFGSRTFLRFGSVQYYAVVFVNGRLVTSHVGGHLPFEAEVSLLHPGQPNRITVAVNNTLSATTVPHGDFKYVTLGDKTTFVQHTPLFDFFNYAGILRPVYVQFLPKTYISGIRLQANASGDFSYRIDLETPSAIAKQDFDVTVTVLAKTGLPVYQGKGLQNNVRIPNVDLWWPRGYGKPTLYIAEVKLLNTSDNALIDVYRETFGFRAVNYTEDAIFINGKQFYCHGFGMHEDFEVFRALLVRSLTSILLIIGRGFNRAVMTKDLNMLEWMHGNCFRTSHYPYSEERAYEADRRGIAVITETPAVGMRYFTDANKKTHAQMLTEMILRDYNHPSTIAWSVSNEPQTYQEPSRQYYSDLVTLAKHLDSTRPITIVYGPTGYYNDKTADLVDIICLNRYYGWYIDIGYLKVVNESLVWDITQWKQKYRKPLVVTEYGADAIAGLSRQPSDDFTEQYQVDIIRTTHWAFDALRSEGKLAGEMIWNFADFMTAPSTTRADGNHKGVLTRIRQPKAAAYVLRERYARLENETKARLGTF